MTGLARNKKSMLRRIGEALLLVIVAVFCLFPIYWILATSFKPASDVFSIPPRWIFTPTLEAYRRVFQLSPFAESIMNSVVVTVLAVIISTTIGTLAAYGLTRFKIKGAKDFAFYMLSTRFAPPVGFVIPFYLIFSRAHLLDTRLGLVLIYIAFNLSFTVWMMKGVFEGIPVEFEEAAMVDGMKRLQVLRKVVLPMSKSGIAATAIFAGIMTWNEFIYALTMTTLKARTLPAVVPKFMSATDIEWDVVCAAGVMIIVPMIVFAFFAQKHIIRGLTMGAVRG
jgi:multiple sugar transport system permease protein